MYIYDFLDLRWVEILYFCFLHEPARPVTVEKLPPLFLLQSLFGEPEVIPPDLPTGINNLQFVLVANHRLYIHVYIWGTRTTGIAVTALNNPGIQRG